MESKVDKERRQFIRQTMSSWNKFSFYFIVTVHLSMNEKRYGIFLGDF